jgi:ketosteroid isomerase-like protein
MKLEICENCKFFKLAYKNNKVKGYCHRYAPDIMGFPRVKQTDTCGEWKIYDLNIRTNQQNIGGT